MQAREHYVSGPWKAITLDGRTYINPDDSTGEFAIIARVHGSPNVPLIVAAPELADILARIVGLAHDAADAYTLGSMLASLGLISEAERLLSKVRRTGEEAIRDGNRRRNRVLERANARPLTAA